MACSQAFRPPQAHHIKGVFAADMVPSRWLVAVWRGFTKKGAPIRCLPDIFA
jgi:hypothetical protein